MEEICSGWLIKSPKTKYVTLFSRGSVQFQIPLKTKWRRRFFTLYKPQGSLPHQYGFDYYQDERKSRKRGSINLEECSKILASLDSAHYPHLFSLKTTSKHNKERVYYLAAETDEEMNKWVGCLCQLCGLRSDEQTDNAVAPPPPDRLDSMAPTNLRVHIPTDEELTQQILEEYESIQNGTRPADDRPPEQRESYTELADCTTGTSPRPISVSMPDTAPPPPPLQTSNTQDLNDDSNDELYDVPRSMTIHAGMGPPPIHRQHNKDTRNSVSKKQMSPSHLDIVRSRISEAELNESSSSINSKLSHAFSRESESSLNDNDRRSDLYDVPPIRRPSETIVVGEQQGAPPPPRPPKPGQQQQQYDLPEDIYQNVSEALPATATSCTDVQTVSRDSEIELENLYDVPKSMVAPAPIACPGSTGPKIHRYVNASMRVVSSQASVTEDMDNTQHEPVNGDIPVEQHVNRATDNVYEMTPGATAEPVHRPPLRPFKPRNLSDNALDDNGNQESLNGENLMRISQSPRTKSFYKADSVFSDPGEEVQAQTATNVSTSIKLPARLTTSSTSSEEEASSESSDDDPESLYQVPPSRPSKPASAIGRANSTNKVVVPPAKLGSHSSSSSTMSRIPRSPQATAPHLRTERSSSLGVADKCRQMSTKVPPPPIRDIQYVELDQMNEKPAEQSPKLTKSPLLNASAAAMELEYTDIDMLKTRALTETRIERDKTFRKRSENLE